MPYEVRVRDTFHASHAIRLPGGDMEPVHWHHWGVEAVFRGAELDDAGVLVDFEVVGRRLREVLAPLEGTHLNDHPFLESAAASAEHVARRIWEALVGDPPAQTWAPARLISVGVTEAAGCVAVYIGA